MPASSAPVVRRMRTLAVLEFANIPILTWAIVGLLGMPLTAANTTGLALVLLVLAEGGAYWWLKFRQLSTRAAAPAGLRVFRVLSPANLAALAAGAAVIGAAFASGAAGTEVWPGIALWVFAVLEHVNYFHVQLTHDTRADLARLRRTGRLHRSHLSGDLLRRAQNTRT